VLSATRRDGLYGPVSELNGPPALIPGQCARDSAIATTIACLCAAVARAALQSRAGRLVGGNFWDMRATGRRLGNPAAEQAEGRDQPGGNGCGYRLSVYRASQRPIGPVRKVWDGKPSRSRGARCGMVCARPGPPPAGAPMPVHLGSIDRGRAAPLRSDGAIDAATRPLPR